MIAIDTSSLIAYLSGETGADVEAVDLALSQRQVVLPPIVLSEIISDPKLSDSVYKTLKELPMLAVLEGYWDRSGRLRAKLLNKGVKAKLADTLIAQSCLDHALPLITRDQDFESFSQYSGLKIIL